MFVEAVITPSRVGFFPPFFRLKPSFFSPNALLPIPPGVRLAETKAIGPNMAVFRPSVPGTAKKRPETYEEKVEVRKTPKYVRFQLSSAIDATSYASSETI